MKPNQLKLYTIILQALFMIVLLLIGYASSTEIVIIYALETILIGIFHVFKMLVINERQSVSDRSKVEGMGLVLFFIVHYGFFVFIQTTFFFVFLSMGDERIADDFGFDNFITVSKLPGVQVAAAVIGISLMIKFLSWLQQTRDSDVDLKLFMFVPYVRILVQQFTAIIPGFFIIFFDGGLIAALVLIIVRSALDLFMTVLQENPDRLVSLLDFLEKQSKVKEPAFDRETVRKFIGLTIEE